MRLHHFYINEKIGDKKEIVVNSLELIHQISKVFRLKSGNEVVIFDGSGSDYRCSVSYPSEVDQKVVILTTLEKVVSLFMPSREITLCSALVKKDTFEWIVEKATELGVTRIIPVLAYRSEKKALNMERLNKIAIEASEQSGRGNVPMIGDIESLASAIGALKVVIANAGTSMTSIVFHTEGGAFDKKIIPKNTPLTVFIGPEGGWSPAEIELFHREKIPVICLGLQVLRAETAVVAALSMVVFG